MSLGIDPITFHKNLMSEIKTLKENKMRRRKVVSKVTQLKHAKEKLEKAEKELRELKEDLQKFQVFVCEEYNHNLKVMNTPNTLDKEKTIRRYTVLMNKVKPFYTGLL